MMSCYILQYFLTLNASFEQMDLWWPLRNQTNHSACWDRSIQFNTWVVKPCLIKCILNEANMYLIVKEKFILFVTSHSIIVCYVELAFWGGDESRVIFGMNVFCAD